MQQMILLLSLALVASVVAQAAVLPAPVPYTNFPVAAPFAAPAPLAVSSSQRLDYFNQFNAAFAPPARLLASPADLAGFSTIFGFPAAAARFGQPARFIAAAPAPAPLIF
ncbi:uncharacterized protein LOC6558027 [Drosophila grimshawi]|uniref:GH16220 n=1 Tax=Drosophila grimshawi TaxID=7222 RepID=B4IXF2_DROGR|nr:uncharacterized protein LOC6558027 [Drosophila grimshawi]EDV96389.1 GH16220 [Drosophila grimshawi]